MFSAVTSPADLKRNILAVTSITTEEALFVAKKDGIYFHGMDPSHVAMVLIDWPSSDFESYIWDEEIRIGLPVDTLSKIVKRLPSKSLVDITVKDDMLFLKSGSTEFKTRLIHIDSEPVKIPKIPTNVEFEIDAKKFAKIIGDVEITTHYINFQTKDTELSFAGKGDDGEVEIIPEIVPTFGEDYKNESFSSYSIEYIKPFINDMEGDMNLKFADNKPVILECGHVMFILAPRVVGD